MIAACAMNSISSPNITMAPQLTFPPNFTNKLLQLIFNVNSALNLTDFLVPPQEFGFGL
jgi:hypothetical protein